MKLSEFIKELQKIKKEKGDLEVYTFSRELTEDEADEPSVSAPTITLDHVYNDNFVKSRKKQLIIDSSVKWS